MRCGVSLRSCCVPFHLTHTATLAQIPGHGPAVGRSKVHWCCEPGLAVLLLVTVFMWWQEQQCSHSGHRFPFGSLAFLKPSQWCLYCSSSPFYQNLIFSFCHSICPFPRKSKNICSLEVRVSYTWKLCVLPGYTALERRGKKEMSSRGQPITWQQEAEALWNSCSIWAWMLGEFVWKLFRLTWTHLCVPLFQQYILTKKPSKNFLFTRIPASTVVLRHWSCFRTQPSCRQGGAVLPWCQVGWDGNAPQDTQGDKVVPAVEVELSTNFHWRERASEFRMRSDSFTPLF